MYVKNNKGLIAIIIILAILVIALGVYIFKRESIRQWVSKDVQKTTEENNTKYEEDVNKIITLGTGMKRPSQYKPSEQYYIIDNRKYELDTLVNSLKNEELKKEINTFIKESTEKLENKRSDFQQYIEEGNKEREKIEWAGNKLDYYRVISTNLNFGDESDPIQIFTEWKCTNGYLSISLSYKYAYGEQISSSYNKKQKRFNYGPYEIYCATYDLYTGKRIQFSDLFFEGEDYGAELYEFMKGKIATDIMEQYVKREFTTLPQDYQYFTIENIIFNKQNLYFSEATEISTAYYYTMFPTLSIARDKKNIFSNDIKIETDDALGKPMSQITQIQINNNTYVIGKIKHWDKNIENKINNSIIKCAEELDKNGIFDKINKNNMFTVTNWQYKYDGEKIRTMVIQQLNNKEQAIEILLNAQTGDIEELYCREDVSAGEASNETVRNSILKELNAILQKLKN